MPAFKVAAALYLLAGTTWAAVIGTSKDFTLTPAHACWNLLRWAGAA
jgi:hypothetical protein